MTYWIVGLVILTVVAAAIGFGFYRGWFAFSNEKGMPWNHRRKLALVVDAGEVEQDGKNVSNAAAALRD